MPNADRPGSAEPLRISILTQGGYLIASIHTALDDSQLVRLRDDLLEKIARVSGFWLTGPRQSRVMRRVVGVTRRW
jgi:hypothetical protein